MIPFPHDPLAAQALESLGRRMDNVFDPAPCLAPEADDEIALVLTAARGRPEELLVAVIVAGVLHLRFGALPAAEGRTSLVRAVGLLVPYARWDPEVRHLLKSVAQTAPELLPAGLREELRTPGMTFGRFKAMCARDIMKKCKPTSADAPELLHAIELFRHSLDDPSAAPAERAERLHDLSLALETREKLPGDLADLEPDIRAWRDAAQSANPGTPEHGLYLHRLSGTLERRFQSQGRQADLDEAVSTARAACAAVADGHKYLPMFQNNLSRYLCRRHQRLGSRAATVDLDEAVTAARAAVRSAGPSHDLLRTFRSTLTKALHARFQAIGDWRDLREAMGLDASSPR
ncbi:hypothetical protein GCM10023080_017130 [Streptomyces pseudoechinosporeus]